jgi:hypothetical protein
MYPTYLPGSRSGRKRAQLAGPAGRSAKAKQGTTPKIRSGIPSSQFTRAPSSVTIDKGTGTGMFPDSQGRIGF